MKKRKSEMLRTLEGLLISLDARNEKPMEYSEKAVEILRFLEEECGMKPPDNEWEEDESR